jgi:uncharacterized protein YbcI
LATFTQLFAFCWRLSLLSCNFFRVPFVSHSSYTVGPKPGKEATVEAEPAEPTTKPTVEQKIDDAVRDLKVEFLGKLTSKEKEEGKFDELYVKLESEYPDHLPLLMAKLKYMDTHQKRSEMLNEVIRAAEAVISRISENELALNLGRKVDSEDGNAIKVRQWSQFATTS